jgi:hypothetical protein
MKEYPSIINSSKAPRKSCIAFDKLDGSNIRVKYTAKKGWNLFGSRTQLIDKTHPHLGGVVDLFMNGFSEPLAKLMKDRYPNEREAIAFGEYLGPQSYAGIHVAGDPMQFVMFDLMVGHKVSKFLTPQEFLKVCAPIVSTPRVIYTGNLSDQLITDVREGKYDVKEGVLCKGTERSGAFAGGVWMCKIKTQAYLDSLRSRFGEEEAKKYGE